MSARFCFFTVFLACQICIAQDDNRLSDLTAAEYAALERASQPSVTGTISFLASDELGGRGTPSKELTIATAYVASRLRAAGAEGLGPDGSYFLESSIETLQTPRDGCQLSIQQAQIRVSLLEGLTADTENGQALQYSGTMATLDAGQELQVGFSGPVLVRFLAPVGEQPTSVLQLQRETRRLAGMGATAVLVEAKPDSSLWSLASQRQDHPRLDSARGGFALPVLVIEEAALQSGQEIQLTIPQNLKNAARVRNVAGVIRGSDPQLAEEALLFSAHLDHLGAGAEGPDPIYNGADDDASGVTAVLTLADIYGALTPRPKRSLIFMTFWGEERGLLGSKQYVTNPAWPLQKTVANINIEMIGRPETGALHKCWMTGWDASNLGSIVAQGSRRLGVETFEHPNYSARLYRASDNYSFAQAGVVAHSFSAGSLHADYHKPADEWQKLDLPHMTQIIRGLYAGTLPIAKGDLTPRKSE